MLAFAKNTLECNVESNGNWLVVRPNLLARERDRRVDRLALCACRGWSAAGGLGDTAGTDRRVVLPWRAERRGALGEKVGVVADQVGEHGAGDLGGEVVERGNAGGAGDTDAVESFGEGLGGDGLAGVPSWEQPHMAAVG